MRPLRLVDPKNLVPGRMYLIQEKRKEYAHLRNKGRFVKNEYPPSPVYCTMTHFTDVICNFNHSRPDLRLQEPYWNYYEADAVEHAYITHVLRTITGDPDFIYPN